MKKVLATTCYEKPSKKGDLMFVVEHECEGLEFPVREYVLFNHIGFAKKKAHKWWAERAEGPVPESVADAINSIGRIRPITGLQQEKDGDFWRVSAVEFAPANNVEQTSFEDDKIPEYSDEDVF